MMKTWKKLFVESLQINAVLVEMEKQIKDCKVAEFLFFTENILVLSSKKGARQIQYTVKL